MQCQLSIGGLSRNALLVGTMLVFAGQTSMLRAQEEGAGTHEEERHGHDNAVALFLGGATHLGSDGQSSETGFARIRTRQLGDRSPSQCGPVNGHWTLVYGVSMGIGF